MLLPYYREGIIEAGCDEAGRGCLAGPVYAAAVILPPDYHNDLLNDSKQLSEKKRDQLRSIIERDAVSWAVGIVDNQEIDQINTTSTCRVIYEGLKRGDEYISFLQSCHIGLCPLSNDKTFQMACFPSKITSYLANGLLVATTENEVLKESCYKNLLFFAEDDSPLAFAETIKKMVNCKDLNPREVVMNEDMRFEVDLSQLLK